MNNTTKRLFGNLVQVICTVVATAAMYVCSYILLIGNLYDEEMGRSLLLPLVMVIPALVIYNFWFGSKAKKFTNGTYPDFSSKYYQSMLFFIVTSVAQYILAFLVTVPLFGFFLEVSVMMLGSLGISEILFLIANGVCFWVFKPVADEIR